MSPAMTAKYPHLGNGRISKKTDTAVDNGLLPASSVTPSTSAPASSPPLELKNDKGLFRLFSWQKTPKTGTRSVGAASSQDLEDEKTNTGAILMTIPSGSNTEDKRRKKNITAEDISESHEKVMIANILQLKNQTVLDFMLPRADIIALPHDINQQDLLQIIASRPHSRFPVYRDTLDDVIGMVHIKDILKTLASGEALELISILRPLPVISPSMQAAELLVDMRTNRQHMAAVVDEYGGIDGLITMEDLIEGIVGQIGDEHTLDQDPIFSRESDGSYIAEARVAISDFEAVFGVVLSDNDREDIDTVGGLITSLCGHIPARGELITDEEHNLEFQVLASDLRRIKKVRIRRRVGA